MPTRSRPATRCRRRSAIRWAESIAAVALAAALLGCEAEPRGPLYQGRGVVEDVDHEHAQVLIAHEDIPGLMPAMTMNFDVPDRDLLASLEPGHEVEFQLELRARQYRIVDVTVVATGAPTHGAGLGDALDPAELAPPFALIDQRGEPFALEQVGGKAVLLDFVYTHCPGPCPVLTGRNVDVQKRLDPATRAASWFVSITLDPQRDTPDVLRRYAEARGADLSDWSFLTGPADVVKPLIESYGVGSIRQPDGTINHLVVTFLIDGRGRIAERFIGLEHQPDEIARALAKLAQGAPS